MNELKSCPFCKGKVIVIKTDDEGNSHSDEYFDDPWSGVAYWLSHPEDENKGCPIANHSEEILGIIGYDSQKEAIKAWNKRVDE